MSEFNRSLATSGIASSTATDAASTFLPPPSYSQVLDHGRSTEEENGLLKPATLVLTKQTIHTESDPSTPLYKVNRAIASLGHATNTVDFERVDYVVHTTLYDDGIPTSYIRQRPRHICDLKHVRAMSKSSKAFLSRHMKMPANEVEFYIMPISRRWSLGKIGLLPVKPLWGEKAIHAVRVDTTNATEAVPPIAVKNAKPLFNIQYHERGYRWADGDGIDLAMEYEECRLVIMAALPQETRDALVALWCCRIWQNSARGQEGTTPQNKSFLLKSSEFSKLH